MTTEAIPNTNTAASLAMIGYGAVLSLGTGIVPGSATYTQVIEITDIDWTGYTLKSEEVTNLGSPNAFEEFVPALLNGGEVSGEGNLVDDASQIALETSILGRTVQCLQIQALVNASTKTYTIQGVGFFTKLAPGKIEAGKKITFSWAFKFTGKPVKTLV